MAKRISGRTFVVGALVAAVGLATEAATAWVRKETPPNWAPVATGLTTIVLAGLTATFDKGGSEPAPAYPVGYPNQPSGGYPGQYPAQPGVYRGAATPVYGRPAPPYGRPAPARRRGVPIVVGLLVLAIFVGIGWAGSAYIGKAIATFRETGVPPWERSLGDGTERLATQAKVTDSGITMTVTSVKVYSSETVVTISVHNDNGSSASIPIFQEVVLNVPGSNSIQPDVARTDSTWTTDVGAGADFTGSIAFSGAIPGGTTDATIVFSNVIAGLSANTIQVPVKLNP